MRYKLMGRSGLRVSEICLGCYTFGNTKWGTPEEDAAKMYADFRNHGGNFLDTANEMYAEGHSEEIVGRLIAGHRHEAVVATKYTYALPGNRDPNAVGSHRKSLKTSLEGSLRRLKTDYVDLLWVHSWDDRTPVDEMLRALDDVVREGKVLYIGASNLPAWIVTEFNARADCRGLSPFVGQQIEYNLIERTAEHAQLPTARHLGQTIAVYAPIAMGILSGKYAKDRSDSGPRRLDADVFAERRPSGEILTIVGAVSDIAQSLGRSSTQVALNWLRQKGKDIIPLVGARTLAHWEDNIGCLDFTLSDEVMERLEKISKPPRTYPADRFHVITEGMIQPGVQASVEQRRN